MTPIKNISPAATALGLGAGDALQQELDDKLAEARKRAALMDGPNGLLGQAISPAAVALGFGGVGMNGVG